MDIGIVIIPEKILPINKKMPLRAIEEALK